MAKILVVDDEKHIVRLVQVNLERYGHEVALAYDGVEALQAIEKEDFDLIVADVMMPRLDGFSLLEQLKKDPKTRDIPVIMLTAKSNDIDVLRGWTSGCDTYLTKPFNPLELVTFVQRILDSKETQDEDIIDL